MPTGSGDEIAAVIRRKHTQSNGPLVICHSTDIPAKEILDRYDDFVVKPIHPNDALALLERCARNRERQGPTKHAAAPGTEREGKVARPPRPSGEAPHAGTQERPKDCTND